VHNLRPCERYRKKTGWLIRRNGDPELLTPREIELQNLLFLSVAGGVGALCRYGLAGFVQRLAIHRFPLGTFFVNLAGCLCFGLVWGYLEDRVGLAPQARMIVLTGFMGSFTTFSTFAFESAGLLQHGQWLQGILNIAGQNLGGIACILLGLSLGRMI